MRAKVIADIIEEFAPLIIQEGWDNSGFSVGDGSSDVHSLIIGLDCTEELIDEAISIGADMIVTHHPLIFGGLNSVSPSDDVGNIIYKAIKNDIVIYSCHTNSDKVINGVSGVMASRLDLKNISFLESKDGVSGLGVVGDLSEEISSECFLKELKRIFSLSSVRSSKPISKKISRVALCGGSGGSLIDQAMASGADVFVTGDISYHKFFCNRNFMVVDIGHFESEIDIVKTIYTIVREKIPTFAVQIGAKNNNPVYYY